MYNRNTNIFAVPLITALVTFFIHKNNSSIQVNNLDTQLRNDIINNEIVSGKHNLGCSLPTKDNPFMNPTLSDYGSDKQPPPKSCPSYNNVGVQRRVEELFNEDLYRDVNDIFGKNNSQRQFYTVPGNQVPNDQSSFANWLYGTPSTCKEGNGIACLSDMGTTGGGRTTTTSTGGGPGAGSGPGG